TLGLDKGRLIGSEQHALIQNDPATPARLQTVDYVLKKKHLRCASLVGKARLGFLAFFAAKRWIHQHDVIERGSAREQPTVSLGSGEGVAVPDVRLIHPVQHKVG